MDGYPACVNDADCASSVLAAGQDLLGSRLVGPPTPNMAGEDFCFFLHRKPGAFFFVGSNPDAALYVASLLCLFVCLFVCLFLQLCAAFFFRYRRRMLFLFFFVFLLDSPNTELIEQHHHPRHINRSPTCASAMDPSVPVEAEEVVHGTKKTIAHHTPEFDIHEGALWCGTAVWVELARKVLV